MTTGTTSVLIANSAGASVKKKRVITSNDDALLFVS